MNAKGAEPRSWNVLDKPLKCVVCAHGEFREREAQLNTAVATFLGFDWANRSATCLVCAECGYVHWFLPDRGA